MRQSISSLGNQFHRFLSRLPGRARSAPPPPARWVGWGRTAPAGGRLSAVRARRSPGGRGRRRGERRDEGPSPSRFDPPSARGRPGREVTWLARRVTAVSTRPEPRAIRVMARVREPPSEPCRATVRDGRTLVAVRGGPPSPTRRRAAAARLAPLALAPLFSTRVAGGHLADDGRETAETGPMLQLILSTVFSL